MPRIFNPITPPFDYYETTDLSGYVPYTGATADVDLGLFDLTTTDLTAKGLITLGDGTNPTLVAFNNLTTDTQITVNEITGTISFHKTGVTPFWYDTTVSIPTLYDPIISVSVEGGTCVATGFWASTGTQAGVGECFSFWGGVRDSGASSTGMLESGGSYGAAALFAYNSMQASNLRSYFQLAGVYLINETSGATNLRVFDLVGGLAQYNDTTTATSIIDRGIGYWVKDGNKSEVAYGLRIDDIVSGTMNYAVDTGTGYSLFGGSVEVANKSSLGSTCLTNGVLTAGTGWTTTGDIAIVTGKARVIHSTGAGTLTQASASLAIPLKANTWYYFTCDVSNKANDLPHLYITTSVATYNVLINTRGVAATTSAYAKFKTNSAPGDFVISSVTVDTGTMYMDTLVVKEITGGDLYVGKDTDMRGDTFWVNDGSGLPYGGFYGNEIGFTSAVNNSYVIVADTDNVPTDLNLITYTDAGTTLTVTKAGRYLCNWYMAVEANTALKHILGGFMVNSTTVMSAAGQNHTETSTANKQYALSGSTILDLAVNDVVGVGVGSTDNVTILVDHVGLTMIMVGGT